MVAGTSRSCCASGLRMQSPRNGPRLRERRLLQRSAARASGTSNKAITTAKWPVRWDSCRIHCGIPAGSSARSFNRTDRLELHFMDCDEALPDSDDHIGASFALILTRTLGTSLSLRAALTLCSHPRPQAQRLARSVSWLSVSG